MKFPSWLFPCAFATRRYALPLLCASVPSAAFAPRRHAKPLLRGAMLCDAFAAHYRAAHSLCCAEPDDAFAMFSFALPRVTFASRNSTVPGATELCLCYTGLCNTARRLCYAVPRCALPLLDWTSRCLTMPLLCASMPGIAIASQCPAVRCHCLCRAKLRRARPCSAFATPDFAELRRRYFTSSHVNRPLPLFRHCPNPFNAP